MHDIMSENKMNVIVLMPVYLPLEKIEPYQTLDSVFLANQREYGLDLPSVLLL
jgi:hypothetical protein